MAWAINYSDKIIMCQVDKYKFIFHLSYSGYMYII